MKTHVNNSACHIWSPLISSAFVTIEFLMIVHIYIQIYVLNTFQNVNVYLKYN